MPLTQLPQIAPFHPPALVRLITAELSEDDLSYCVGVDAVYAALVASRAAIDPCRDLLAMLV
jgi:hypothetical protein